jgi:hypothetical protein
MASLIIVIQFNKHKFQRHVFINGDDDCKLHEYMIMCNYNSQGDNSVIIIIIAAINIINEVTNKFCVYWHSSQIAIDGW